MPAGLHPATLDGAWEPVPVWTAAAPFTSVAVLQIYIDTHDISVTPVAIVDIVCMCDVGVGRGWKTRQAGR